MRNLQRASENALSFSMQSTPIHDAEQHEEESVWDVWPYCWAIDGWDIACENFENQRAHFATWKLARFNRRAQEKLACALFTALESRRRKRRSRFKNGVKSQGAQYAPVHIR